MKSTALSCPKEASRKSYLYRCSGLCIYININIILLFNLKKVRELELEHLINGKSMR